MKHLLLLLITLTVLSCSNVALADTFTFTAPATAAGNGQAGNGGVNQFDLDHYKAYTWSIGPSDLANQRVNLVGMNISSASLTFNNISNWDRNDPNRLFVHMFDFAKGNQSGSASVIDDTNGGGTPISDYFTTTPSSSTFYADSTGNALVDVGTDDRKLFERSFDYNNNRNSQVPSYRYDFSAADLKALNEFFNATDKTLAFGFDADCHFWNNGIVFQINTASTPPPTGNAPVPEPATMMLLGTGLIGIGAVARKQRRAPSSSSQA